MNTRLVFTPAEWNYLLDGLAALQWVVLCDEHTAALCLPGFRERYLPGEQLQVLKVPAGEAHKTIEEATRLWKELMDAETDREAVLVNLGGGMLTDLGGFVAALYKRGLRTIHVPTTLLAMTDAAIGGKNGVNFQSCKNQLGTFRAPDAVVIDPVFLKTLPYRQLRSGFAETIKHALIQDEHLWGRILREDADALMKDPGIIRQSIGIKQHIVAQDPLDHGIRQALNFGHTIGHAIEAQSQGCDKPLLHGECIALGMLVALELSVRKCGFPSPKAEEARQYISGLYHDLALDVEADGLMAAMKQDKKNRHHSIVFSLLRDIGTPVTGIAVEKQEIESVMEGVFSSLP